MVRVFELFGKVTRMVEKGHKVVSYNRSGHHVAGAQFDGKNRGHDCKGVILRDVFTINRRGLAAMT